MDAGTELGSSSGGPWWETGLPAALTGQLKFKKMRRLLG